MDPIIKILRFFEAKNQYPSVDTDTYLDHILKLSLDSTSSASSFPAFINIIGKNQVEEDMLQEIIKCGFSAYTFDLRMGWCLTDIFGIVKKIHRFLKEFDIYPNLTSFCITTKGPTISGGKLKENSEVLLEFEHNIILTTRHEYYSECTKDVLYVDFKDLPNVVSKNQVIYLENGSVIITVTSIGPAKGPIVFDNQAVFCMVIYPGVIHDYTFIFIKNFTPDLPEIHSIDKTAIKTLLQYGLNTIFINRCCDPDSITLVRQCIDAEDVVPSSKITIFASIGHKAALKNIDELIQCADAIHFDRNELAHQIGYENIFLFQKQLIAKCNKYGKPILITYNVIPSYKKKPVIVPRASLEDISSSILDGVDGVVIPGYRFLIPSLKITVENIMNIIHETESYVWYKWLFYDCLNQYKVPLTLEEGLSVAAIDASVKVDASAIIIYEREGHVARTLARFKPRCTIIVVTNSILTTRNLIFWRRITPLYIKTKMMGDWDRCQDTYIQCGIEFGKKHKIIQSRDPVIVLSRPDPSSKISEMRIIYVSCD